MEDEYDFTAAKRGPIARAKRNKERITIRLDRDVIQWFQDQVNNQGGGSYQALINEALRQHIGATQYQWEETIRRVIREELHRYGDAAPRS